MLARYPCEAAGSWPLCGWSRRSGRDFAAGLVLVLRPGCAPSWLRLRVRSQMWGSWGLRRVARASPCAFWGERCKKRWEQSARVCDIAPLQGASENMFCSRACSLSYGCFPILISVLLYSFEGLLRCRWCEHCGALGFRFSIPMCGLAEACLFAFHALAHFFCFVV